MYRQYQLRQEKNDWKTKEEEKEEEEAVIILHKKSIISQTFDNLCDNKQKIQLSEGR